jgi:hypothetical protein
VAILDSIRATGCSRSREDTLYDHALGILQLQSGGEVARSFAATRGQPLRHLLVFAPRSAPMPP